ncbi:M15 family metallopeptidase [Xanthobacter sp. ZOL 2024]
MAQTLEDYIISLGLKVDKAQEQRFNSALDSLGKTFAALAAGLTAAAATIQATVVAVSKSFDNLYFAAQRTNSTVAGIKALSYAFSQIGASGAEAQSSLEGLSKALRTNPGTAKWLNAQGIATEGRKTEAILSDIFEKFGKMPQYLGYQFAEVVGVSEETFNKAAKQWPQVIKWAKEFEATQARFGVDPDKAAESSNKLMTSFRALQMDLDALFTKITVALQPQLNHLMADIAKWFEEHQEQIVRILNQILEAVKGLITDFGSLLKALEPVADKFAEMVELLTGEKNSLKVALEVILAFMVGKWLLGMLGVFDKIVKSRSFGLLMLAMGMGYDMLFMTDEQKLKVGSDVNDAINGKASDPDNWWTRGQNAVRRRLGMPEVDNKGNARPQVGADAGAKVDGVNAELKRRYDKMLADAPENVRSAISVNSGYRSIARQEQLYREAVAKYGPAEARKWVAPPGKSNHNFGEALDLGFGSPEARAWVHSHAKEYGLTFPMGNEPWHVERAEKRGRNPNWEDDAIRLRDKQSELFGAPALGSSSARLASISNRTSITVYGSSDPAGTAANLSGAQSRVASDLIRNGQSAFV